MKKLFLLQIAIIGILFSCTFAGNDLDKEVLKAYDTRMSGKVDEAKSMLDSILSIDSTHAMAHFEMARLQDYMITGGADVDINDIIASIDQAVKYDPDNATYAYFKATISFLNAYISMQSGGGDIKDHIAQTCKEFEKVLSLDPDCAEAMLYLVDIYGLLPVDMGGDSVKALEYAEKLTNIDGYFAARAKATLSPDDMDYLKFWEDLVVLNEQNPDYLKEAGTTCLYLGDPEKAEEYFKEAIEIDPSMTILILNLARFHMYQVMQNQEIADTELPLAIKYTKEYIDTDPPVPLKAYSYGLISRFERFSGNDEASKEAMEKANFLDHYFSRATGVPSALLFDPPDKTGYHYGSFFSPY